MGRLLAGAGLVVGVAAVAAACSPFGNGEFHCETNDQCVQAGSIGTCVPSASGGVCTFGGTTGDGGMHPGDSGGHHDGPSGIDGPPLGDASICVGTVIRVCAAVAPADELIANTTIDTGATSDDCLTTGTITGGDVCVVLARNLTVGANVAAKGARPLVLAATGTLEVAGTLDVSSTRGMRTGPGADDPSCGSGSAAQAGASGGGGGAGGTFQGQGGNGGATTAANGGQPSAPAGTITTVRGGCAGQIGAKNAALGGGPGSGGDGGGAVLLISATTITVDGAAKIFAGGAGGGGAAGDTGGAGGGGAGTGGLVGFDAMATSIAGQIFANGGAGGGGAGIQPNAGGGNGDDGQQGAGAAKGGKAGTQAGAGGDGSSPGIAGLAGLAGTAGGGGGGGGAGWIYIFHGTKTVAGGAMVSPPALP